MAIFQHKGYDININSSGHFTVSKDDFTSTTETLEQAKAAIDREIAGGKTKTKLAFAVIGRLKSEGYSNKGKEGLGNIAKAVLIGINRTTAVLQFSGLLKGYTLEEVMADTPENNVRLAAYIEAKRRYEETDAAVKALEVKHSGYGRIDAGKYDQAIANLTKLYEKSKKG